MKTTADDFYSMAPKYRTKSALAGLVLQVRAEALDDASHLFVDNVEYDGAEVIRRIESLKKETT